MRRETVHDLWKIQAKFLYSNVSISFTLSLFLLFVPVAGYGQAVGKAPGQAQHLNLEDLPYRIKGADIPKYHLVNIFFLRLSADIQNAADTSIPGAEAFYEAFLGEIGIEPNSLGETALRRAAERFQSLTHGNNGPTRETWEGTSTRRDGSVVSEVTVRTFGGDEQGPELSQKSDAVLQAEAQAFHVKQARGLADIYHDLQADLEKSGISATRVESYLYEAIAAETSLASDEPHDAVRPYVLAFEERLEMREVAHMQSKMEN